MPMPVYAPTSDKLIRIALIQELTEINRFKEHTRVIPELTLPNESSRVDVAVVNGIMHGYELKSDLDTLSRLNSQVIAYNSIFDKVTLVVGKKHAANSIGVIPEWWGVTIAKSIPDQNMTLLIPIREASTNTHQDLYAVANMLWRSELVDCLSLIGKAKGYSNKSKNDLCRRFVENTTASYLKKLVRDRLISRQYVREKQAVLSLS